MKNKRVCGRFVSGGVRPENDRAASVFRNRRRKRAKAFPRQRRKYENEKVTYRVHRFVLLLYHGVCSYRMREKLGRGVMRSRSREARERCRNLPGGRNENLLAVRKVQ